MADLQNGGPVRTLLPFVTVQNINIITIIFMIIMWILIR